MENLINTIVNHLDNLPRHYEAKLTEVRASILEQR